MGYTKRYLYEHEGQYYLMGGISIKEPIGFMVVYNNYPLKKDPIELINTFKNIL